MRAFIVRPFGIKNDIDFDRVEELLIAPALEELGIGGRTTAELIGQGNIRSDMFHLLLTADLVIADLSIHNANVFYELGIRHAFRDRHTFLIRSSGDAVPFDLKTDRYLKYDSADPGASVATLTAALRRTLDSEDADSPVFQLVPALEAQGRARLVRVPPDFLEEVARACRERSRGDLQLLAHEVARFGLEWAEEGLRAVGEAQFQIQDFDAARETWEELRRRYRRDDPLANQRLATIYQKLGDLTRSDQAFERAIAGSRLTDTERAELHALRGSNEKTRWLAEWQTLEGRQRLEAALSSPHLSRALEAYNCAFSQDVNHYYSGLNALALATVQEALARAFPEIWEDDLEEGEDLEVRLRAVTRRRRRVSGAVWMSLEAARQRSEQTGAPDPWLEVGRADYACLTGKRARRVGRRYRQAIVDIPPFNLGSIVRQLEIFEALEVLPDNVAAALEAVRARQGTAGARGASAGPARVLVFTGHRIDAPDRVESRFPAAAEGRAREMIRAAVEAERTEAGGELLGYAGGASGADILFHEICLELGVDTRLLLTGPRDAYVRASVQDSGAEWVRRFDALHRQLEERTRILSDELELPRWLRDAPDYSIWQRNNLWELYHGLAHGSSRVTLIALWNRQTGDGPGGTADMVRVAEERGARTVILDARELIETR